MNTWFCLFLPDTKAEEEIISFCFFYQQDIRIPCCVHFLRASSGEYQEWL